MSARTRSAAVCAAVFAAMQSAALLKAADLTWDADPGTPGVQDGSGNWNTTTANWFNGTSNVLWSNATPDSAFLGNGGVFNNNTAAHNVTVTEPITVQNLTFDIGADGGIYNVFDDFGGGALTLAGNIVKSANNGVSQILLGNRLTLSGGQHTFTIRDTPGDTPELTVNAEITGAGGVTIDNSSYEQWGTTVFNFDNTYIGATNVTKGRLVINTDNALGSGAAGVTIANQGALSVGGAGTVPNSSVTISKPITVTRNTYTGTDFNDYPDAFISANAGGQHTVTLTGPIVIDSTDARFRADTSKIIIATNLQQGPNTPNAVFTADGDSAGTIALTGNNTALLGGIRFMGGVEVDVTNQNNLAGPSSPLTFTGGLLHPIGGFMSDFGTHVVNVGSFSGGIDVDGGQTFTINQNLTGGSLGKRGDGLLNVGGANNLTGGPSFFDSGTVNFTGAGTSTYHSIHLRSPTVNIGAGTIVTTNNYTSFGQDSHGTNGGPDKATVNIFGTGALILGNADFNISDNADTAGTVNLSGNGILHTTGGLTWLGKGTNAAGTLNQSGGTVIIDRGGDFAFVLGDGRFSQGPKGFYNLSGGAFTSAGEVYAGEGNNSGLSGTGTWTQSGGTANINNWFVVGREGGVGTVDLSGGTLNHNGGNISMGDSSNPSNATNLMTVRGNAVVNDIAGEFWVGNNGGALGILNVQDSASITINSWFAVGRNGGTGTVNMTGGTITKNNTDNYVTIGAGGSGTVNVSGGVFNSAAMFLGESQPGMLTISGTGVVNLSGNTYVRLQGGAQGNLLMSGGTLINTGTIANCGNINLTGGVATLGVVGVGTASAGAGSLNLSNNASANAVSVVQPAVSLANSSRLSINPNGTSSATSKIDTLTISDSAKLDLNDNDMIVVNGGAAALQAKINSARNGGAWNGPGITSTAAANNASHNTTLGVLTGAEYSSIGGSGTFSGQAYAATDTLVKYTYYGDTDFNGKVNFDDYVRTDNGFNNHLSGWLNGDFNGNGQVNFDDYVLIDLAFNTQSGTLGRVLRFLDGSDRSSNGMSNPAMRTVQDHLAQFGGGYASAFLSAVPEPGATVIFAGVAAASTMRRRRRR